MSGRTTDVYDIRPALADEHMRLLEIARSHPVGGSFSHTMFSGPDMYKRGWIRAAVGIVVGGPNRIAGFTCFRHKIRQPKTKLYYIIVDRPWRRRGVGQLLLTDLITESPHRCMELDCEKGNAEALAFYDRNGFARVGETKDGKRWVLELTW